MPTPHNEAPKGSFAKTVIMPGDPFRAKYIAEKYLQNVKLINQIRGMYAYTGKYHEKEISVMAHGMGIPSIGIYSYELYKEYDVENIIRVGSCGACVPELKLFDVVLVEKAYSESNYSLTFNNEECHLATANETLNQIIETTARNIDTPIIRGNTITSDCFGLYMTNGQKFYERIPKEISPITIEMEAFGLFYNAKLLGKKAACLLSVVDSEFLTEEVATTERQTGLDKMIRLALEAGIKM